MTPEERRRLEAIAEQNSVRRTEQEQQHFAEQWAEMTDAERAEWHQRRALAAEFFETNKSAAAQVRDAEQETVDEGGPHPVDLRSIPREKWDEFVNYQLVIPPDVAKSIEGEAPYDRQTVAAIEQAVEKWHGITPPFFAVMDVGMQQLGRGWKYVPEAAPYLT